MGSREAFRRISNAAASLDTLRVQKKKKQKDVNELLGKAFQEQREKLDARR